MHLKRNREFVNLLLVSQSAGIVPVFDLTACNDIMNWTVVENDFETRELVVANVLNTIKSCNYEIKKEINSFSLREQALEAEKAYQELWEYLCNEET